MYRKEVSRVLKRFFAILIALCVMFSAALRYENFYGTQFHPEKSGSVGERILQNFLAL